LLFGHDAGLWARHLEHADDPERLGVARCDEERRNNVEAHLAGGGGAVRPQHRETQTSFAPALRELSNAVVSLKDGQ
jgi:hypothetical protein